ncbi:hypothetical protein BKH41_01485 [Helicobacter sp. 12S02232-10]|nr:hypothetical protein BKH41_01485 [Helicobacter sp. 12S02232-10]
MDLIKIFSEYCLQNNIESFINLAKTNLSFEYAQKYGFQGVHIKGTELNYAKILSDKKIKTFYSAHQDKEVFQAIEYGVDFVVISPIFQTPGKPKPLGLKYLDRFDSNTKKYLFALGGIVSQKEVDIIKTKGLRGFASIRYFLNN